MLAATASHTGVGDWQIPGAAFSACRTRAPFSQSQAALVSRASASRRKDALFRSLTAARLLAIHERSQSAGTSAAGIAVKPQKGAPPIRAGLSILPGACRLRGGAARQQSTALQLDHRRGGLSLPRKKSPALWRGRVSLAWRVPARGTAAQIDNIDKAELVPAGFIDFGPLVRDVEIETVRVTRLLPRS
jgi:hypothetical protein